MSGQAGIASIDFLIVDDNPPMRVLLRRILSAAGATELREAGDVEAARARLAEQAPDILLLDNRMPGMSGVEFARGVRADRALGGTRIIMITGDGDEFTAARAAGVDEFVVKPVHARALLQRIADVLARPRAA